MDKVKKERGVRGFSIKAQEALDGDLKPNPDKGEFSYADLYAPSAVEYISRLEESTAEDETLDILTFWLCGSLFALDVSNVGAVIVSREVAKLPHTPDFIDGLISVRGEMILVMNLKKRLSLLSAHQGEGNILITEGMGRSIGLAIDKVVGVTEVVSEITPPKTGDEVDTFLKGTITAHGVMVRVIDMKKLLDFVLSEEAI